MRNQHKKDALRLQDHRSGQTLALLYVGDQIADLIETIKENAVTKTAASPFLPLEEAKTKPVAKKPMAKEPVAEDKDETDSSRDQ